MSEQEFDVIVIGMGPGGEHVAGELAKAGLSVAGIEERLVGGECPYYACVPTKMMVRAANLLAEARRVPGMAGSVSVSPDWAPVAGRIRAEATDDWDDTVAADRFTAAGGTLLRGHGRITGPGQVSVAGQDLTARRGIVINTGTAPAVPPVPGLAGTPYWTNRDIVQRQKLPASLVVLGGGAVGTEQAQVFSRFGSRVTVIEAAGRLLPGDEPEAGELLRGVFTGEDITVRTGSAAERIRHDDRGFTVMLADGSETAGEQLLVATGRRTDLAGLGVAAAGLDENVATIATDGRMRAADGIWAIGDITGHGAFTHMSMYQAGLVIADILGQPAHPAEYHAVPRVTFTDPEIGAAGLTEAEARQRIGTVRTGFAEIPASARGWIHKAGNDGFIKVVADADRGVLVGATSAGPAGGEVLSMLTLAIHAAIPVQRLAEMIYAYPTFHRAVPDAIANLG